MKRSIAAAGLIGALALPLPLDAAWAAPDAVVQPQATAQPETSAQASATDAAQISKQNARYLKQNAQTNLAEIATGTYAAENASTPAVRAAGKHFAEDHAKALKRLRKLAEKLGKTLPSAPNAVQKKMAANQMSKTGREFDLTYLRDEIAAHKLSIAQTRQEINAGSGAVQEFARWYLPIAQEHLKMAREALQRLKNENA